MPGLVHLVSNNDCLLACLLLHLQATLELLADHATVAQQQKPRTVPELLCTRQPRQVLYRLRQLLLCLQKELLFLLLQLNQMEHPFHRLLHWLRQILLLLLGRLLQLNQLECPLHLLIPLHPNQRLPT